MAAGPVRAAVRPHPARPGRLPGTDAGVRRLADQASMLSLYRGLPDDAAVWLQG